MHPEFSRGRFTYFPAVPGRLEFALEVRNWILEQRPQILAVELPRLLRDVYLKAIDRLPALSILRLRDPQDPGQWVYVPIEPSDPFVEAVRTADELGIPVEFIEPDCGDRPHLGDVYPDTYAIQLSGMRAYVDEYRFQDREITEEVEEHAALMARRLQGLDPEGEVLVVVSLNLFDALLEAMEVPQDSPAARQVPRLMARLFHADPACLGEATFEMPHLIARYEQARRLPLQEAWPLVDRMRAQDTILSEAEVRLFRATGVLLENWQRALVEKYARNLAHVTGDLLAGITDLTVAARGVGGDNFANEVWQVANHYPPQLEPTEMAVLRIKSEEIWCVSRRVRLRPRDARPPGRWSSVRAPRVVVVDRGPLSKEWLWTTEGDWAGYSTPGAPYLAGYVSSGRPIETDVWSNPRFDAAAEDCAERLLLAAIEQADPGMVIEYLGPRPPRALVREIGSHAGVRIRYQPIGSLAAEELAAILRPAVPMAAC